MTGVSGCKDIHLLQGAYQALQEGTKSPQEVLVELPEHLLGVLAQAEENITQDNLSTFLAYVLSEKTPDVEKVDNVFCRSWGEDEQKDLLLAQLLQNEEVPLEQVYNKVVSMDYEPIIESRSATALLSMLENAPFAATASVIEQMEAVFDEREKREWDFEYPLARDLAGEALSVLLAYEKEVIIDDLVAEFEASAAEIEQWFTSGSKDETCFRGSWGEFKQMIKDHPRKTLFMNEDDERRKKQYYRFGCQYLQCLKAALGTDKLEFVLAGINKESPDSFVETCSTGWSERLLNIARHVGVSWRKEGLFRPLQLAQEVRRDIVTECTVRHMALAGDQNPHTLENVKGALNSELNLGYTDEDMPGFNCLYHHQITSDVKREASLIIERELMSDVSCRLKEEWKTLSLDVKEVILAKCIEKYDEIVRGDLSLLVEGVKEEGVKINPELFYKNKELLKKRLKKYGSFSVALWMIITKAATISEINKLKPLAILQALGSSGLLLEDFQELIQNMSAKQVSDVFLQACLYSKVEIMKMALDSGKVSSEDLRQALQNAADKGDVNVVRLFLESGFTSAEDRAMSLASAVANGHTAVVRVILESGAVLQIHSRGWGVVRAAQGGKVDLVDLLLQQSGSIMPRHRGLALVEAASIGNKEIARLLLKSGEISHEDKIKAAASANKKGFTELEGLINQTNGQGN